MLEPLPFAFAPTRDALHALACYAVAPARKARTGRIGLRSTGASFGTPPFDDGTRIVVRGTRLVREPRDEIAITTVRAAAEFLDVALSPDPGVGKDLPPYEPDRLLPVEEYASRALGAWYGFGDECLAQLQAQLGAADQMTEPQLWPEHFDLAVEITLDQGRQLNVGFSPGDTFSADPYLYVGPWDLTGLTDDYWNAPFGAFLAYDGLSRTTSPRAGALQFVTDGLHRLRSES